MKRFLLLVFFLNVLWACGSSTKMVGSWTSSSVNNTPYQRITVMALTSNIVAKRSAETNLAEMLGKEDVESTTSITSFSPTFQSQRPSKDEIIKKLKQDNQQAIITMALVEKNTEQRYVPGTTAYSPYNGFGRFGNYYSTNYPTYYDPGYYTMSKVYYVQTNLYDVSTEELIWSAQSKTYDPENLESVTKNYSKEVVKQMKADGII